MLTHDPLVRGINDSCDCFKAVGVVLGGFVIAVVASPIAMAVSILALPILGIQYWMESRNHRYLLNKTIEVYDGSARQKTGPTPEKNYMENIPKELDKAYQDNGSKFNNIRDLSWLWFEHHRLNAEDKKVAKLEEIKFFSRLLIPIAGIASQFLRRRAGTPPVFERDENPITPIMAVKAHFWTLRDKFQSQVIRLESSSSLNKKFFATISNTLLDRPNGLLNPKIPKDLPAEEFFSDTKLTSKVEILSQLEQLPILDKTSQKMYLVRHGESTANVYFEVNGKKVRNVSGQSTDIPLTDTGRKQILELAEKLAKCFPTQTQLVITNSTALRTQQTAKILYDELSKTHSNVILEGKGEAGLK